MRKLEINIARCPQSHSCPSVNVCQVGALTQDKFNAPVIDHNKCVVCGRCVNFCPMKAFYITED
ncbi:MAG: 4Fe-4S binding protein [Clostridia bacterium]